MQHENSRDVTKLRRLAEICGVRLSRAADRARIGRRTIQMWVYHGTEPRADLYERAWNAVIDEARENGTLTVTAEQRCREELGVIV